MHVIDRLCYFDDTGRAAACESEDDPFGGPPGLFGPTRAALGNARRLHLRWTCVSADGAPFTVEKRFSGQCRAVRAPDGTCVACAIQGAHDDFQAPCNGAVFAADGALLHRVCPPAVVEHRFGGGAGQAGAYPAHMLDGVQLHMGRIAFAINFAHEWNQLRVFDPVAIAWGDVIGVYRR